ncbi:MAG: hypothetical protein HOQ05_07615 [Corynebacteriales bacterium]|nr:hypothetical protein [Mycobacteriales bacterium]
MRKTLIPALGPRQVSATAGNNPRADSTFDTGAELGEYRRYHRRMPVAAAEPAVEQPAKWWDRFGQPVSMPTWREALRAVVLYGAVASIAITVLLSIARANNKELDKLPWTGDAGWYLTIAENGYDNEVPHGPNGEVLQSRLAFFPAFPALIRATHEITRLDYPYAGMLVSLIGAIFAAVGIFTLARGLVGERAGLISVGLFAIAPASVVQWIPYTESIATALIVWTLIAVLNHQWLLAGGLTFASGLVRPTTTLLVAAVGLAAIVAIVRKQDSWRPWVGGALAPLGIIASWGIIGSQAGQWDAWFEAEKAEHWDQRIDFGEMMFRVTKVVLKFQETQLIYLVTLFTISAAVVLWVALATDRRIPWVFVALVAMAMVLVAITSGGYTSKTRYLLPFMPLLLLPIASVLSKVRIPVLLAFFGVAAMLAGWYGAYLLTYTHESI